MEKFLIPLGIIVLMTLLGYAMQWLKNASAKQQEEKQRERAKERRTRETVRTESRDLDRYLRAVDAQRSKPLVRSVDPVPTAAPVKRPKIVEEPTPDFPAARPGVAVPVAGTVSRLDVPMAAVVSKPKSPIVPAVSPTAKSTSPATPKRAQVPVSPLNVQLLALLKQPQSAALAIVLTEVLGPPKCKKAG